MTERRPPDAGADPAVAASRPARAAGWVVRMGSDQRTREDESALQEWLRSDRAAGAEYAAHQRLWDGVGALADDPEARALLRSPRATAAPARDADAGADAGRRAWRRRLRLPGKALALAGVAAVAVSAAGLALRLMAPGDLYSTVPGEQRRIALADGSTVTLNTDSRLRVRLDDAQRRLVLERGQAYFEVARDAARPFRVFAGRDEVRAIGTAFQVRKDGESVQVVLEQGVVAIYRNHAPGSLLRSAPPAAGGAADASAVVLRPGHQARLGADGAVAVAPVDLAPVQAWRYGRLILNATPLGEVVDDINRYGGRRIVLADPALAKIRVSGVFHVARAETLVEAVTTAFPVRLAHEDAREMVLAPR